MESGTSVQLTVPPSQLLPTAPVALQAPEAVISSVVVPGGRFSGSVRVEISAAGEDRKLRMNKFYEMKVSWKERPTGMMLPQQSSGTCYVYAAIHSIMSHPVLLKTVVNMLRNNIMRSKYAAKAGETSAESSRRRGFKSDMRLSVKETKPLEWMTADPAGADDVISVASRADRQLFDWIRQTVLYVTIMTAAQMTAEQREQHRSKQADYLFAMMAKKQRQLAAKKGASDIMKNVVGGLEEVAFSDVLKNVGAKVRKIREGLWTFAFPEGLGAVLVETAGPPNDSSFARADRFGMTAIKYFSIADAKSVGHAVAYFRVAGEGKDWLCVVDSNTPYPLLWDQWIKLYEGQEIDTSKPYSFVTHALFVGDVLKSTATLWGGAEAPGPKEAVVEPPAAPEEAVVDSALMLAMTAGVSVDLDPEMAANFQRATTTLNALGDV